MFSVAEHVLREACADTRCMSAHTRVACSSIFFKSGLGVLNTTKCRTTLRLGLVTLGLVVKNRYVMAVLGSFSTWRWISGGKWFMDAAPEVSICFRMSAVIGNFLHESTR